MAIHELATNAVKHGALSVPEGDILVSWTLEEKDGREEFILEWVERNGPPVKKPQRRGFGTTLIERGLAHDLDGKVELDFAPVGLRARLQAPVRLSATPHDNTNAII